MRVNVSSTLWPVNSPNSSRTFATSSNASLLISAVNRIDRLIASDTVSHSALRVGRRLVATKLSPSMRVFSGNLLRRLRVDQLEQFDPHTLKHVSIIAPFALPEQAHARIPGAVVAPEQPAIIRRPRQQNPCWT